MAAESPGSGYLRIVGPVALRFLPVPAPVTNQFVLPPPPPPVLEIKVDTNAPVFPPVPASAHEEITNEASSAPPPPLPEPPRQDEVVSPQVFLKYFNKGTNGIGNNGTNGVSTTVVAPLDFNPPKAPDIAPSKATFSTGQ